jgi:hypothetical protein
MQHGSPGTVRVGTVAKSRTLLVGGVGVGSDSAGC